MDLIDIFFDFDSFCRNPDIGPIDCSKLTYKDALELYKKDFVPKCINLVKGFEIYTQESSKECLLHERWLGEINKDKAAVLVYRLGLLDQNEIENFKSNLKLIALNDPASVESLLGYEYNIDVLAISALSNNYNHRLSDQTLAVLQDFLNAGHPDNLESVHFAVKLLVNQITHWDNNGELIDFLFDLIVKKAKLIVPTLNKINSDLNNSSSWKDTSIFDKFPQILKSEYSKDALGTLLLAQRKLSYEPNIGIIDELMSFDANFKSSKEFIALVSSGFIRVIQDEKSTQEDINKIQNYVSQVFNEDYKIGNKVVLSIMDYFDRNQSFFADFLLGYIADTKYIGYQIAENIEKILLKLETKKSLFIIKRLLDAGFIINNKIIESLIYKVDQNNKAEKALLDKLNFQQHDENENICSSNDIPEDQANLLVNIDIEDFKNSINTSHQNALNRSLNYLLFKANWQAGILQNFIDSTPLGQELGTVIIIEKLADYQIKPDDISRFGESAKEIIENFSSGDESKLNQLIKDSRFIAVKKMEIVLQEMQQSEVNNDNKKLKQLLESGYFKEQLLQIEYNVQLYNESIKLKDSTLYLKEQDGLFFIVRKIRDNHVEEYKLENLSQQEIDALEKALETKNHSEEVRILMNKVVIENNLQLRSNYFLLDLNFSKKPLSSWSNDNYLEWARNFKVIDNEYSESLKVVAQAAHNIIFKKEFYPRPIQMVSVLAFLNEDNGEIIQVETGEGKSLILAMFSVIKILTSGVIDTITSDSILAARDSKEFREFYKLFGIDVDHNIQKMEESDCYEKDIVYGDMRSFIGDDLRDTSGNVRRGRGLDTLIIDEIDHMFIDQSHMKVQLTESIPGFDLISQHKVYLYGQAKHVSNSLYQNSTGCFVNVINNTTANITDFENIDLESLKNISNLYSTEYLAENCTYYLKNYLNSYAEDLFLSQVLQNNFTNYMVYLPKYLKDFVADHIPRWIDSIISSFNYKVKNDYILLEPNSTHHNYTQIVPIEVETGQIQKGLILANGVHQFLQIENKLTIQPETLTTTFKSFYGFFQKYKGSIYGVTGTLGEKAHHDFLKAVYGVELAEIPAFVKKDLTKFSPIVTNSYKDCQEEILGSIERKIAERRASLIIVETIEEVESLKKFLSKYYDSSKIFVYGTGKNDDYDVGKPLGTGEIIIATNAAGRGTDLKITSEVKKNGGLHVIMTDFSTSIRVEDQGFGRSARKGEPGSGQYIIFVKNKDFLQCSDNIECLAIHRKNSENDILKKDRLCNLPSLGIRDQLYDMFVELRAQVNSPTNYTIRPTVFNSSEIIPQSLYISNTGNLSLTIVPLQIENATSISNITDIIKAVEPKVYNHLTTILARPNISSSSISWNDYELLHYISAINNFTHISEILQRVDHAFKLDMNITKNQYANVTGKISYLQNLFNTDGDYSYLTDNTNNVPILKAVELKKKFKLWLEDRSRYNNRYEIKQIAMDFGIWLKKIEERLNDDSLCNIDNEEETSAKYKLLANDIEQEFTGFIGKIQNYYIKDELMRNPGYLVQKAWQYVDIYSKQQEQITNAQFTVEDSNASMFTAARNFFYNIYSTIKEFIVSKQSENLYIDKSNYAPTKPLEDATKFLSKAKLLDNKTWTAYTSLSYITLIQNDNIFSVEQAEKANNVKEIFADNMQQALSIIHQDVIPAIEAQLSYLVANKHAAIKDDIAVQLIGAVEIYRSVSEVLERNLNILVNNASSSDTTLIIGRYIPYEEVTQNINITEKIINILNASTSLTQTNIQELQNISSAVNFASKEIELAKIMSAGGMLFEVSYRYLEEEDDDWFGTFFSIAIGIASIYAGFGVIGAFGKASVFGASLGTSLIAGGIGDIIGGLLSVGQGVPIDIDNYFKSKGMSIGIAIVTAGTLHFLAKIEKLNSINEIAQKTIKGAKDTSAFLTKAATIQTITLGLSTALYNVAKNKFVDSEDNYQDALSLAESIISDHKDDLAKIYASDEANGNRELQQLLEHKLSTIISKYRNKYHEDKTKIATEVPVNVAGFAMGGFNFMGGLVGIGSVINTATKFTLGYLKNQDAFDKINSRTRSAIAEVASLAKSVDQSQISSERFASYANKFKTRFTDIASRAVTDTQRHEMLKPVTDMVANEFGNKWGEKIANHIITENRKAKYAAEIKSKSDNDSQEPANDNNKKEVSDKNKPLQPKKEREIVSKRYVVYDEEFGPEQDILAQRFSEEKLLLWQKMSKQFSKAEASDQFEVFKHADKVWIVSKLITGGAILMTKEQFAKEFPDQYKILAEYSDKFGKFIGKNVAKIDQKLYDILGDRYSSFKYHMSAVVREIDQNSPQIVSDGIKLIIIGGTINKGVSVISDSTKTVAKIVKKVDTDSKPRVDVRVPETNKINGGPGVTKKVDSSAVDNKLHKVANDNFDLKNFEGGLHNGHAMERHVGKSTDWLKGRIDTNPKIIGSTSFPDLATANKYTKETLLRNKDAIESWLGDVRQVVPKSFKATFSENLGYGYNNKGQFFDSINKVNVVLKKTEDGFIVYTSHPLIDKVKK